MKINQNVCLKISKTKIDCHLAATIWKKYSTYMYEKKPWREAEQ